MHNLTLRLDDSVYQQVLDFLETLPKNLVKIDNLDNQQIDSQKIDLGQFRIQGLKKIQDPVVWQQNQRDEWQ